MKNLICFFISVCFSIVTHAHGGTVGNGGVVIICPNSSKSFSLDYILGQAAFDKSIVPVKMTNLETSLSRISTLLQNKLPSLSNSFAQYLKYIKNSSDSSQPYFWIATPFDIPETNDQEIDKLPSSCKGALGSGAGVSLYQAVVRNEITDAKGIRRVVFQYDPSIFRAVSPLQESFIYVHEWLWDLSSDIAQNRKINYFLHSNVIENMPEAEVVEKMKSFGLKL